MQDVVDVHDVQEDLLRATEGEAARRLSKSNSLTATTQKDPAAPGLPPALEQVTEGDEGEPAAGQTGPGVDTGEAAGEAAPSLLSRLPSEGSGEAQGDADRSVFADEPSLESAPSKMVLLQSNPGLTKLADEVPADAVPLESFEDVSSTNWGLEMLVRVGESWAPNLLEMTQ